MRWLVLFALGGCLQGCGSPDDFVPPPRPDMRVSIDQGRGDRSVSGVPCFSTACGGCSQWMNFDGSPAKVGDPCLWDGVLQCAGSQLVCSSTRCLPCSSMANGTVCGADGHTIVELLYNGSSCAAYDFGSVISTCNHSPDDHCVGRCTNSAAGFFCAARCTSADGGATGCPHQPTDTCMSLSSC